MPINAIFIMFVKAVFLNLNSYFLFLYHCLALLVYGLRYWAAVMKYHRAGSL